MSEITKVGTPAIVSALTLSANRIAGSMAGEDLAAGDACYINSDGRVYLSRGSATDEAAGVRGFAIADAAGGAPTTLVFDVTLRYGEHLPAGVSLFLSGQVPGGLADRPAVDGRAQVAYTVDATRIHVMQS